MLSSVKRLARRVMNPSDSRERLSVLEGQLSENKILAAKPLVWDIRSGRQFDPIHRAEFKVFSQFEEDGIVQYLINNAAIQSRTFIEFGVEDYTESNTRFLLLNDNWRGLVLDPSSSNIEYIKRDEISWRHTLTAVQALVTPENVNELFESNGFTGQVGILSIDIDGNDYFVWDAVEAISPTIVIVEFNSVFGPDLAVTVPYQEDFRREVAHFSNLYWGASLPALKKVAERKGYALVGCTSRGLNAFFVRNDSLRKLHPLSVPEAYVESSFRDSRDENGKLDLLSGNARLKRIAGMPVLNVETGKIRMLGELET